MRVGSLFSGVGGFDLGLERAGHEVVWQVEYDKRARSVLRRHWPGVDLYEDVRNVGRANLYGVDLICGGFPCQDLSVAGRRAGLDGDRSGLWFEFHRIVSELAPTWVLIENVPGLLSSNGGADFAVVLRGLAELGYWWAYRVLDSQFAGVAQRRRRVFVLACNDPRAPSPAEILAIPEGLSGHPAPSREAGAGITPLLEVGARTSGDGYRDGDGIGHEGDPMYSLQASKNHGVAHTLRGEGFDASEDGTVAALYETANTLSSRDHKGPSVGRDGLTGNIAAVYRKAQKARDPDDCERWEEAEHTNTLAGHGTTTSEVVAQSTIPRRLTPTECSRLQGFPDDWTSWGVDDNGERIELSDSPRYRMYGNAVTVTVAQWLGERLHDCIARRTLLVEGQQEG